MTTRIHDNLIKGIFFIILFIVLMLQSIFGNAQNFPLDSQKPYKGMVVGFGTRSSAISSDIEKIHQTSMLQTGGHVGLIFGNNIVRSKIGLLGYYSSTGINTGTTDLYESNVSLNFYPLSWISGQSMMIEPYLTGGVDYDQFKFYGYYLNQEPGETNYSKVEAPYLGKIKQLNATVGVGIEVKLEDRYDFVHLFSEVKYGMQLSAQTSNTAFVNTGINNQMQVVLGISVGIHR